MNRFHRAVVFTGLAVLVVMGGVGGCAGDGGKGGEKKSSALVGKDGAVVATGRGIKGWDLYTRAGTRRLRIMEGDRKGAVVERTLTVIGPEGSGTSAMLLATALLPAEGEGGSALALQTLEIEVGSGGEILLRSLIDHGRDEKSVFEPPLVLDSVAGEKSTESKVAVSSWVDGKEGKVSKRGTARCLITKGAGKDGAVVARTEFEIDLFPAVVRSVRESSLDGAGKLWQREEFLVKAGPIKVRGYERVMAEE